MASNCASCHKTPTFPSAVSTKHMASALSCTDCYDEHKGREFSPSLVANERCTSCHRDGGVSNGKILHSPHGGTLGYPVVNGNWTWAAVTQTDWQSKGLSGTASSYSSKDQFHLIHVAGKDAGRAKCSDCHTAGFDPENIRTGVRE